MARVAFVPDAGAGLISPDLRQDAAGHSPGAGSPDAGGRRGALASRRRRNGPGARPDPFV
ncbi:hypothetical protein ACFPN7_38370 [Amycolatopsis halotolerans]|uniref:hypothetical protein n=1 Tax=Amycolatopsis halotolerans TaxID=330083 RepID=UPI0036067377